MKLVHAIQILGTPRRIDMQVACPGCSARAMAFSDGSIMCIAEGGACYEPEPSDAGHPAYGELLRLRGEFDKANGISVTDRALLPTKVLGAPPQVAPHGAPEGADTALSDGDRALFLNSAPSLADNERIGGTPEGLKPWDQLI
jgi:hypothetical protein